jgi:hypothetical protein
MIKQSGAGTVTFDGTLFANTGAPFGGGGNIGVTTGSITIAGSGNLEFSGTAGDINATFDTAPLTGDPLLGRSRATAAHADDAARRRQPGDQRDRLRRRAVVDQRGMLGPIRERGLTFACDVGAVEANSVSDLIFANGFESP